MTVIAGAVSLGAKPLPADLRIRLLQNLSRTPEDRVQTFGDGRWQLAKVDVGAYRSEAACSSDAGAVLVVAGEPLLAPSAVEHFSNRQEECARLFADLRKASMQSLRTATGVFCGAFYDPEQDRLVLVADKLGLRPIYYAMLPDAIVFASALRILEAADVPRGVDLRGTYETCAFGFPLADRTCYANIRTIGAAETISVEAARVSRSKYHRWDVASRPQKSFDEAETIIKISERFSAAVHRRLRGDRVALAFLSGGLDSRAILATLRSMGTRVLSVNFAPPGSQDRLFAGQAAAALGSTHHQLEVPLSSVVSAYRQEQLKAWVETLPEDLPHPDRPGCIWSGDGGSVGVGHVYLDRETVSHFDEGRFEDGIAAFLSYNRIGGAANSALADQFRDRCRHWHIDGVRDELARVPEARDSRAIYLFLLLNDQRRHLAKHFENIDQHRFEFHVPFFDSDFLQTIVDAPSAPFLGHRLYHKWLARMSPQAVSVPWQTYPNHEPCPIPIPHNLLYQWSDESYFGRGEERKVARALGREALRRLFSPGFPGHLVHRGRFAAGIATALLGSDAWGHVVRVGDTFLRCWSSSNREFDRNSLTSTSDPVEFTTLDERR